MFGSKMRVFAFALCAGGVGCDDAGTSEPAAPVEPAFDRAAFEAEIATFDSALEAFLVERELDGATAVVVHRDEGVLHQRAYGSFDVDRVSLIASVSKTALRRRDHAAARRRRARHRHAHQHLRLGLGGPRS